MQNKPLFGDVAPLIWRFPPDSCLSMQGSAPSAAILGQLLSQLVARFLRFMQRWLFWLLPLPDWVCHAPAPKTNIAAAARQAGVVLETGGKYANW